MTTKTEKISITVRSVIKAPVAKVWHCWTDPKHIMQWNNASDDWHTTKAENDLRVDGKFLSRMEAKDGSMGFDFSGEYVHIVPNELIEYVLDDDRKVINKFESNGNETTVTTVFEAEHENTVELQQTGWQAILDNFKKHVETPPKPEVLHFEITIHVNAEKVYHCMLDESTYNEWTSAFNPTSTFVGSWEKGSKILFVGTDSDGKTGGMVSRIAENIPNKFVSIEHLGWIQDEKEITSGPGVDEWVGAKENYTFTANNDSTLLAVDLDSNEEFKSYFIDTWPKALDILKNICER